MDMILKKIEELELNVSKYREHIYKNMMINLYKLFPILKNHNWWFFLYMFQYILVVLLALNYLFQYHFFDNNDIYLEYIMYSK